MVCARLRALSRRSVDKSVDTSRSHAQAAWFIIIGEVRLYLEVVEYCSQRFGNVARSGSKRDTVHVAETPDYKCVPRLELPFSFEVAA